MWLMIVLEEIKKKLRLMKLTFYFFIASVANVENNAFLYICD